MAPSHGLHSALFSYQSEEAMRWFYYQVIEQTTQYKMSYASRANFKGNFMDGFWWKVVSLCHYFDPQLNNISPCVKRRKGCGREEPQRITLEDNNSTNPPNSIFFLQIDMEKQRRWSGSKWPSCQFFLGSEESLALLLTTALETKRSSVCTPGMLSMWTGEVPSCTMGNRHHVT